MVNFLVVVSPVFLPSSGFTEYFKNTFHIILLGVFLPFLWLTYLITFFVHYCSVHFYYLEKMA